VGRGRAARRPVIVERDIRLEVPPERAYELVMDPRRLGDWVSIHAGFKEEPPERLEEGSELAQRLKIAGQRFTVHWEVTSVDHQSRVVWSGRGPAGTTAEVTYRFEPEDGATRFRYRNEYKLRGGPAGKAVGRALSGSAGREADRTLEQLKRLLES